MSFGKINNMGIFLNFLNDAMQRKLERDMANNTFDMQRWIRYYNDTQAIMVSLHDNPALAEDWRHNPNYSMPY